jgi:hypothetical protein
MCPIVPHMDEMTESVKARISPSMFNALRKIAQRECVPVSHVVRTALRVFLQRSVSQQGHKVTR